MVHGDIKPGNVLLSGDNPAKIRLSDFGLSQWRAAGLGHTLGQSSLQMTAHFKGTSIYAPPEMLRRFLEDSESDEEDAAKSSRFACGKALLSFSDCVANYSFLISVLNFNALAVFDAAFRPQYD